MSTIPYTIYYKKSVDLFLYQESNDHFRYSRADWLKEFYNCKNHDSILAQLFPTKIPLLQQMEECQYTINYSQWRQIYNDIKSIDDLIERFMFLLYLHYLLVFLTNDYHQLDMLQMLGKESIPLYCDKRNYILYQCRKLAIPINNMYYHEIVILVAKVLLLQPLNDMQKLLLTVTYQLPRLPNKGYLGNIPRAPLLLSILPTYSIYYYFQHIESYYNTVSYNNFSYRYFTRLLKNNRNIFHTIATMIINTITNSPHTTLYYILFLVYNKIITVT